MIVITGATGKLGRLVIAELLKTTPPAKIVAAVRNPAKAEDLAAQGVVVRRADYDDPAAWDRALEGGDKVLLISSNELGRRVRQHRAVIDAAVRRGVRLLAYTSILHADRSPLGIAAEHRETEALIRASGLPAVLLRNGWYTENYTAAIPAALAHGALYGCAGDGRIASAARADFAEAAAAVLTAGDAAGRIYELAGDDAYRLAELAAEIALQSGQSVNYMNLPEADYRNVLVNAGVPEEIAAVAADAEAGISRGGLFDDGRELSRLINRPTTPLAASVAAVIQLGRAAA